jgi:hypothetical protein
MLDLSFAFIFIIKKRNKKNWILATFVETQNIYDKANF